MTILRGGFATLAALALLPTASAAHQGHGPTFNLPGLLHWLSSPHHLVSVVAVVAVVGGVAVAAALHRRGARSPARGEER